MKIRSITENDIISLSQLFVTVFNQPPWSEEWEVTWAQERLFIIVQSYRFYGLLAEINGQPIAAVFSRLSSFKGRLELEIIECFVTKDYQRKGVASTLLDELKIVAKKDQIKCFVLLTDKNTYAIRFYQKYGFQVYDENQFMAYDF